MLYILGGAARASKSKISRKLLSEQQISYFPIDILMIGLTKGVPTFGIDPDQSSAERAEKLWPIIKGMSTTLIEDKIDYLIEGDALLPKYMHELIDDYGNSIKACFIGYTSISLHKKLEEVRAFPAETNDWMNDASDEVASQVIQKMIDFSAYLKDECNKYSIPYFDSSANFSNTIDEAYQYLTQQA